MLKFEIAEHIACRELYAGHTSFSRGVGLHSCGESVASNCHLKHGGLEVFAIVLAIYIHPFTGREGDNRNPRLVIGAVERERAAFFGEGERGAALLDATRCCLRIHLPLHGVPVAVVIGARGDTEQSKQTHHTDNYFFHLMLFV